MKKNIPHLRPWIIKDDIRAVNKALSEKSVSHFHYAYALARELKNYSGFKSCALYASGTLALRAALLLLKLPKGSAVAIPSFTCQGVLNGVLAAGYKPYITDCDNCGLIKAEDVLKAYKEGNVSAAVAVHQFGLINSDMERLSRLMPIIEDCSHVPPRSYIKGSVSICGSLEGTKFLGAGEGGYALFNVHNQAPGSEIDCFCLGNRISDPIAVLALCQFGRISKNIQKRKRIAGIYGKIFSDSIIVDGNRAAWFRFLIRVNSVKSAEALIGKALRAGITLRRPIMPHPLHGCVSEFRKKCPNAENLWETLVSIPVYPDLKEHEINSIAGFLRREF